MNIKTGFALLSLIISIPCYGEDAIVQLAPGSSFVIKDSSGNQRLLSVNSNGELSVNGQKLLLESVILDHNDRVVGRLSGTTYNEELIVVNSAYIKINGRDYFVPISADGFENSPANPFPGGNTKSCSYKLYESHDCSGNFYYPYVWRWYDEEKLFENWNPPCFVSNNKLYEFNRNKVLLNLVMNSAFVSCPGENPGYCTPGNYTPGNYISPDGIKEIADLTVFQPPFRYVVD